MQYDENQFDECNETPKSRTEQLLNLLAVLDLPNPKAVVLSVQSQDCKQQPIESRVEFVSNKRKEESNLDRAFEKERPSCNRGLAGTELSHHHAD